MNWDDLRIAVAVSHEGSFARAARAVGVDETTVARRVARLEAALGLPLFDAVEGVRRPTARGAEILRHAASMEQASAAIEVAASAEQAVSGRLRLSTTPSIAAHVLAPGLDRLLQANPALVLSLETAHANADFARWETDMAIRLGRPRRGNYRMRKLGDIGFRLVRPRRAAWESASVYLCAYPDDLAETPEMRALAVLPDLPPTRLETADVDVIARVLEEGRGMAIVPDHIAGALETRGNVRTERLAIRREAWLLIQPHLRDDRRARAVADWAVARFRTVSDP